MLSLKHIISILLTHFELIYAMSMHHSHFTRHTVHSRRDGGLEFVVEVYHPATMYETYGAGIEHPLSKRKDATFVDQAAAFVHSKLGINATSTQVHAAYEGFHANYVYLTQRHHNLPITNAIANVAFDKSNRIIAFGSSFVHVAEATSLTPSISMQDAIAIAETLLDGAYDTVNFPAPTLEYLARPDKSLALTHVFQVRNMTAGTWYQAAVDAHSGQLLSITNFVAQATYRALPITKQALTGGFEDIVDPQDPLTSPLGWHNDGKSISNSTAGNNGMAYNIVQANLTFQSAPDLSFIFPQDPSFDPTTPMNLDAARVNSFYVVNMVHDITYRYGFTERAFNFQTNNFGLGGRGNDRVEVNVQAQNGFNNAQFTTLPDGINGFMYLYVWDETDPRRDSGLENDIIVHENTHGITNRMTGGGTAMCLQTLEAGGLGEGWSDAMAEWTEQTSATIKDYVLGAYVTNNSAGIRTYPYSTSNVTNPLKYSSVASFTEVHQIGEVWANMLHNVYASLVGEYGFSQSGFTDPSGSEGNIVFLHLFIDALPIQPCNPTFVSARDAWIQADVTRYGGANRCILWRVFASRGLGVNAANYTDDFMVPADC